MDIRQAEDILELTKCGVGPFSLDTIKKQYRIMALKYHPDKNKMPDAVEKFQQIQTAYETLSQSHGRNVSPEKYERVVEEFLSTVWNGTSGGGAGDGPTQTGGVIFRMCIFVLVRMAKRYEGDIIKYLRNIDREVLLKLCEILKTHREVFHVSPEFLQKIIELVEEKQKNTSVIILNPFIEDLIQKNLYRMKLSGKMYLIPLWHHELVYDNEGADLHIRCFPVLPENMEIDEYNNLHVYLTYMLREIWGKEMVKVEIGGSEFRFSVSELKMRDGVQMVKLEKCGVPEINMDHIYKIEVLRDIYLYVTITL